MVRPSIEELIEWYHDPAKDGENITVNMRFALNEDMARIFRLDGMTAAPAGFVRSIFDGGEVDRVMAETYALMTNPDVRDLLARAVE